MKFYTLKNKTSGFTLIELLVVIAIIGILSSVVLASLSTARQKSRDAKRISDIGQLQLSLELYYDGSQQYPVEVGAAYTVGRDIVTPANNTLNGLVTGQLIPRLPTPPNALEQYYYSASETSDGSYTACTLAEVCLSFLLGSNLERDDNVALKTGDSDTLAWAIDGADTSGCLDAVTTNYCYDIRP